MLEIKNLTKQYKPGKPIFTDYSNRFDAGKCVGVFGPNGSGKTTFLRILSVNSYPTNGTVLFEGIDIHENPGKFLESVGLVHDEETLPQHLTAVEMLEWILRSRKLWSDSSVDEIDNIFDNLALVERNEQIGTYSTGMKKKTQIAAAFILKPKILIMDEPLRGLDQATRKVVSEMIARAKKENRLILMSSHSIEFSSELFDEMIEFPL
ncbi:MAG: ABC transporter ATP-binding protein [Balneolaceae bacterium]|nr:MAG: ABC transporter ATP-binding protein [Balneolaceae bacterium]